MFGCMLLSRLSAHVVIVTMLMLNSFWYYSSHCRELCIIIIIVISPIFIVTILNQALFLGEPFSAVSLLVKQVLATATLSC
jgi:hypothetical protein